jgi:hypothetical protein
VFGYICIRNLRFTYSLLNFVFVIAFLVLPFWAIRPVLRLSRAPKIAGLIVLTPVLCISVLLLIFQIACVDPRRHDELVRDLGTVCIQHSSVHLVRDATGGALGPHGLSLEQHLPIVLGVYALKYLDWYDGARSGSVSMEGNDCVRVRIPKDATEKQPVDETYRLKEWMYF